LTPERWAQIAELFHRAAECEPEQRVSLLNEACRNDPELRREVDLLLSSDRIASGHVTGVVREGLNVFTYPLAGEVVSHYRILDGLGGGGMGLVYRAEDIKLGRQVALKFLAEESAKDPVALARFEREARSASALEHPNICPIHEFGEHEGQPFLVMQLLEGQSLRDLISAAGPGKSAVQLDKLLDLGIQIGDALDAAHKKGIIHRDIKPANIFITNDGQAKVLDFGLAKFAHAATVAEDGQESDSPGKGGAEKMTLSAAAPSSDLFLSRTGLTMGTAGYMSPEQVRGERLDARTDLFSFGLVLYEMATGQRAFAGDTGQLLQEAILKQLPASVREFNPRVPAKLQKIIHKALAKDREARYQSAAEMHSDLEALKREIGRRLTRGRNVAAGIVGAILIASATFWLVKRQLSSTRAPSDVKSRQLTTNSSENRVLNGAISPDGKYLAYTDLKGMHIKLIATGETKIVPQPGELETKNVSWEILSTAWFPNSTKFLANAHLADIDPSSWSSEDSSIWEIPVLAGMPRKVRDHAIAWSVSPDGSTISFGANNGKIGESDLWLMDASGEHARKLFDTGENSSASPMVWLPEKGRVIYVSSNAAGDSLVSRDLEGGPVTTLLPPSELKKMGDGIWLPDGRWVYSMSETAVHDTCNYWAMRINPRTGQTVEQPRRLTNWADFCVSNPSVTADGKRLAFLQWTGRDAVYVADLDAAGTHIRNSQHLVLDESFDYIQCWTPDGKAILFTSNRDGRNGIYKQSLDKDTPELIAIGEGTLPDVEEFQTQVSPDGKWVLALLPQKDRGTSDLLRVPITGGSPEVILRTNIESGISCAGPHSNLCVLLELSQDRKQAIVTSLDPVKGRGPELTRFDLGPKEYSCCVISPDGTRLAEISSPTSPIQILSLRGDRPLFVPISGSRISSALLWSADSKGFYFGSRLKGGSAVSHLDMKSRTHVVWENRGGNWALGIPSPDGRHLAIAGETMNSNMWMMENF
jgi:serine/threonine protein kinase